jgi:hypothetical protein
MDMRGDSWIYHPKSEGLLNPPRKLSPTDEEKVQYKKANYQ